MRQVVLLSLVVGCTTKAPPPIPVTPATLSREGRDWQLVSIGSERIAAGGPRPSLRFGSDGALSGQSGCNAFGGRWSIESGRLVTGAVRSTQRACIDDAVTRREGQFLATVGARPKLGMRGDTLVLDATDGTPPAWVARLVASP